MILNKIEQTIETMKNGEFTYKFSNEHKHMSKINEVHKKLAELASKVASLVGNLKSRVDNIYSSGQTLDNIAKTSARIATEVAETVKQHASGAMAQVENINICNNNVSEANKISKSVNTQVNSINEISDNFAQISTKSKKHLEEHPAGIQAVECHADGLLKLARDITVSPSIFKVDDNKPVIFYWKKNFFTKIADIDFQHYKIVNYINNLYQQYVAKISGYPKYDSHIIQHKNLLNQLAKFIQSIKSVNAKIGQAFLDFLNNRLSIHILEQDMQYSPFFKSKGLE